MTARRVMIITALLLLVCGCSQWSSYRGDVARTAYQSSESKIGTSNVSSLHQAWTGVAGGDLSETSPVIAGGVAYVGSSDGKLYAFDAAGARGCSGAPKTCQPLWTATINGSVSTPAVAAGTVYVTSGGKLYAFDASGVTDCAGTPVTCGPLWTTSTSSGVVSGSPAVSDGFVFTGGYVLYAFDAAGVNGCGGSPTTCAPLWVGAALGVGTPAVSNHVVYAVGGGRLFAFAESDAGCSGVQNVCSPLFSTPSGTADSVPVVSSGRVYEYGGIGTLAGTLLVFDAAGVSGCAGSPRVCQPLWRAGALPDDPIGQPAVAYGRVYVAVGNDATYAFDASGASRCSGTPKVCLWEFWTDFLIADYASSPVVANGVLYTLSIGVPQVLMAHDAQRATNCSFYHPDGIPEGGYICEPLGETQLVPDTDIESYTDSPPAIAGGVLYFGMSTGKLVALST